MQVARTVARVRFVTRRRASEIAWRRETSRFRSHDSIQLNKFIRLSQSPCLPAIAFSELLLTKPHTQVAFFLRKSHIRCTQKDYVHSENALELPASQA
jgi:hypothetical protein